jgi:hypothetical protein
MACMWDRWRPRLISIRQQSRLDGFQFTHCKHSSGRPKVQRVHDLVMRPPVAHPQHSSTPSWPQATRMVSPGGSRPKAGLSWAFAGSYTPEIGTLRRLLAECARWRRRVGQLMPQSSARNLRENRVHRSSHIHADAIDGDTKQGGSAMCPAHEVGLEEAHGHTTPPHAPKCASQSRMRERRRSSTGAA